MELYKYPADKPFTQHDMAAWAFIAAISDGPDNAKGDFHAKCQELKTDGIPIELKIAGTEFKFTTILKRLEQEWDRQVLLAARGLLEEKASELHEKIHELTEEIDNKIKELFPKQGDY